jgi:NAD(P)-dependent dehydrogenase (short-subunit alcohol dehydrogenase family)
VSQPTGAARCGRLAGKRAVVTGAGSGIGQAAAVRFAAEGATVACVGRDPEKLEGTVSRIRESGGVAVAVTADVTRDDEARRLAREVLSELGHVDIVYACAGISGSGRAADTTESDWQRVIATNLTGKWLSFKYFLPSMVERRTGSIIVMSSVGAVVGVPNSFPYAAAVGGCSALVRQAAADYASAAVRFNAIAPATVPTELVREAYRHGGGLAGGVDVDDGLERARARYPLSRLGTVDDIAGLATYVASDEASWTTGQVFVIDGGFSAV